MAVKRVLIAASEVFPFAKTGGLADVTGSLAIALMDLGVDVRVVLPHYRHVKQRTRGTGEIDVPFGKGHRAVGVRETKLAGVPVNLIQYDPFFDRGSIYGYKDDAQRFALFSRGLLEMLLDMDWIPDIVHCNDWHTGLVPAYLRTLYRGTSLGNARTLYTIHNLQYQGNFRKSVIRCTGLPRSTFHNDGLAHHGKASYMKSGIVYSDAVNTVSRRYSQEVLTREYGQGMHRLLRRHSGKLHGILNGIDVNEWDPSGDRMIRSTFDSKSLDGKAEDKRALQREMGLPTEDDVPLFGMVSRLSDQKGLDILAKALPGAQKGAQFVILGTGHKSVERALAKAAGGCDNVALRIMYDEAMAHWIYAGSDVFLVPSRFEPCGLTQMIAMRYGSVPLVRRTGGLADTVRDAAHRGGTGFVFTSYTATALQRAARRAVRAYRDDRRWNMLRLRCMAQDFSWDRSAKKYLRLYNKIKR